MILKTEEWRQPARETFVNANAPLSIVVVYEDFPARVRIQHVYWMLLRELSKEYDFECSWYGFDDLGNVRIATSASVAAANADLILFSVNGVTEPPESVRQWIESWIGTKAAQDAALAALLNGVRRRNRRRLPIWNYLRRIAQRAGMSFLPEIIAADPVCGQAC